MYEDLQLKSGETAKIVNNVPKDGGGYRQVILSVCTVTKVWAGGRGYTTQDSNGRVERWDGRGYRQGRGKWSSDLTHLVPLEAGERAEDILKGIKDRARKAQDARETKEARRQADIASFWEGEGQKLYNEAQEIRGFAFPVRAITLKTERQHRLVMFIVECQPDNGDGQRVLIEHSGYLVRTEGENRLGLLSVSSFGGQIISAPTLQEAFYEMVKANT